MASIQARWEMNSICPMSYLPLKNWHTSILYPFFSFECRYFVIFFFTDFISHIHSIDGLSSIRWLVFNDDSVMFAVCLSLCKINKPHTNGIEFSVCVCTLSIIFKLITDTLGILLPTFFFHFENKMNPVKNMGNSYVRYEFHLEWGIISNFVYIILGILWDSVSQSNGIHFYRCSEHASKRIQISVSFLHLNTSTPLYFACSFVYSFNTLLL